MGLSRKTKGSYPEPLISRSSIQMMSFHQEKFEDNKVAIRIRVSKKNRQHNGQQKKYKMTNNDLQNINIKLKIE